MARRPIRSSEVPQANDIGRVQLLARLLHGHDMAAVAAAFSHARDQAFYLHAARLLGFVDEGDLLTPSGRSLAMAEGTDVFRALAGGFVQSVVGSAWMRWAEAEDVRQLEPADAERFLAQHCTFAESTQRRRASTLAAWVEALRANLPPRATSLRDHVRSAPSQPSLTGLVEPRWPPSARFPHNEGGSKVREILRGDLDHAQPVLLVSGYSSLDTLIPFLAARPREAPPARLLLGTEPFPARRARLHASPGVSRELVDYWLQRGISMLLCGRVLEVRERLEAGEVVVRTSAIGRPVHAKMYVSPDAVTLGSSNFTHSGLGGQSEANARFAGASERRRIEEASELAEGLWSRGEDFQQGLLDLLEALLSAVTWQEALGRACAALLEGDWAKRYVPAGVIDQLDPPLWRHQLQGISQSMWVLENVGSVLVADATGSGKTRMGAWLIRGAFDRQYRLGFVKLPAPLVLTPPQVAAGWEAALRETGLTFQVESHGPLSSRRAARHEALVRHVAQTELLAVDEAHNFVNRSERTVRLVTHYAENAILFTATPINRGAGDLLALVELLGADNLPDASLAVLSELRRGPSSRRELTSDLEVLRQEIRRFTVRRTRNQLNEVSDAHPEEYTLRGRQARYPVHAARYFDCRSSPEDDALAREIAALADALCGVTRLGKVLRAPPGLSPETYLRRVATSARALARHHVMSCLRSSAAALVEHVLGTAEATRRFLRGAPTKSLTGDMVRRSRAIAGKVPAWELEITPPEDCRWLVEPELHAERAEGDAELYRRIGALAVRLSGTREQSKVDQLHALLEKEGLVIAFDSHIISLRVFEQLARARGLPVECLTGEGGAAAKRRAVARLGLTTTTERLVALCTDAFSEGLNLQRASCVVHLDTPTVIRLAEQRAGRVDRMDSPHDQVSIWWPKDAPAFAPRRKDLLRARHTVVRDLIGANLALPEEPEPETGPLTVEELARRSSIEAQEEDLAAGQFHDAFRAVRELVSGPKALVERAVYRQMRDTQAEVVACVSMLQSETPWCFAAVGGPQRAAPRWVLMEDLESALELDLGRISAALRRRLHDDVRSRALDEAGERALIAFVERLRQCEHQLLPIRRRRALQLLEQLTHEWTAQAQREDDHKRHGQLRALREWLCLSPVDRRVAYPDPGAVSDAWLRLLRPRIREALERRRSRYRPWRLDDLLPSLIEKPIPVEEIWKAFDGIELLAPVDERIVAMIVGA